MGTLPGIVLLAAVIRIAFQLKNRHRLFLSDFFLLLASTCLIAGTIVIYQFVDMLYLEQQLSENPLSVPITPDFLNAIPDSLKYLFSYQAILWAVVFSVKFSFLSFFRPLVSRLAKMITWWKCVTVTTAFAWAVCTVAPFIICPHFDFSSSEFVFKPLSLFDHDYSNHPVLHSHMLVRSDQPPGPTIISARCHLRRSNRLHE